MRKNNNSENKIKSKDNYTLKRVGWKTDSIEETNKQEKQKYF